ncbi:uncharacterized protein [Acropora muricata]|uniref:uncharacterized protein n=1 Tax=Acropora muricata TaxID=159855 RepID=UPI0034E4D8F6
MACSVSPWEFKHLEVLGTRVPSPVEFGEISARIPRLKIETRTPVVEKKNTQQVDEKVPRSPTKRQNLLYVKPQKEKTVTFKVVLPKEKSEVLERNYLCICEERHSKMSTFCSVEDGNDVKEIEFSELMELFNKCNERSSVESFSKLTNTTRGFHGNKILSDSETIEVMKLLGTDIIGLKEGLLLIISQLCMSTVNVKRFLENGLMNTLMNLMLLSEEDDVRREAVICLSQVVEKTEHADFWLEQMVISGLEALLGLMALSESLQEAVLIAIKNLAVHPKGARAMLEYDLGIVTRLTSCKNSQGNRIDNPQIQGLATQVVTNLISHDSSMVEEFLSKHDDVVASIVDLLQFSPCPQQVHSARFLATLAFHKSGLAALISHNAVEHLLRAVTCSQCRRLRHQASTALRNISANPDKTSALFALSLAAVPDTGLKQRMDLSETSRTFVSGGHDTHAQSTNNLSRIPSSGTSVDTGNANSNHQRTISEVTSLLTLVFQSDTLSKSGSGRQFFQANNSKLEGHRLSRVKQSTDTFCAKESYLNSLQVLTNTLIVMSNLLMASESMDDKNGNIFGESRRLENAALIIQHGGLQFLPELEFLSKKLLEANPPSSHNIDPTILPPKEITSRLKNARTDLIFNKTRKGNRVAYQGRVDFGFQPSEVDFVKAALELVRIFAETTAPEFDPGLEDIRALEGRRPRAKKRHISFHNSATTMSSSSKMNKRASSSKVIRKRRPLSRSLSLASVDTLTSSKQSQSSLLNDASAPFSQPTDTQDSRDTRHYVKQSLLDSKVIYCLAPWIMCGIYDIQADALKIIRYLQHSKYASSVPTSLSHPKEAWTSKVSSNSPPTLTSRSSTLSQRSLNSSTPARNSMNKSKYLGATCVRHVIHHCAGYLLDSLEPPVPRALGRTSLMVIREAVINGALDTRLKIIKLGCFAQVIKYIRGNEDDEALQALGIVVVRILVGDDKSLKQLFLAHGGMNLIMALYQYKQGIAKEQAALTMLTFRKVFKGETANRRRRPQTADPKIKKRSKSSVQGDIWEKVGEKWKGQDKVTKLLKKFNVRY